MNIPSHVARAQAAHGCKGADHGIKGAVHGIKGGRPRLALTDEERVQRRRDQQQAYRRRKGIMPKQVLTWEERQERNRREHADRLNEEYRRIWRKLPGVPLTGEEFAKRYGAFRAWVRSCQDRCCPLYFPVDFVRRHYREARRQERDWMPECSDAVSRPSAARRTVTEWERRELNYSFPPIAEMPSVGRNQPCPCGSGRKSKKCCGSSIQ